MSISPQTKPIVEVTGVFEKMNISVKKTLSAYFVDPLHYIFYVALSALMIGLFFGHEFSWEFHVAFFAVGCLKVIRFYKPFFKEIKDEPVK